jgi:hypothetical protein
MAKVAVIGHDEDRGGAERAVDRTRLVDEREQHGIGRPSAAVPDPQARGDALAADAALGRPVEDDVDGDRSRDGAAEPPDQRRPRRRDLRLREGVQQVRAVDQQPLGGRERVCRICTRVSFSFEMIAAECSSATSTNR